MRRYHDIRPEGENKSLRFAVAGIISRDLPAVFPDDQTGDLAVGDRLDVRVVGHRHVPLVEVLVVPDDGVLGPDVADQAGALLVHHHVGRVEPSPVAQSSQLELDRNQTREIKSQNWKYLQTSMFLVTRLEMVQALQGARSQPYTLSRMSQSWSTQLWSGEYSTGNSILVNSRPASYDKGLNKS